MQRIKLIFACKFASEDKSDLKFKVSVKNDWIYNLEKEPEHSIGFTLRKFKIATTDSEERDFARKYRAYRVREDPKTRFRYVTEILNMEEAKQLVNKKWAQVLIAQKSMIKDPAEDFKLILDEGERKMLQQFDEDDDRKSESKESDKHSSSSNEEPTKSQPSRRNLGQKRTPCANGEKVLSDTEQAAWSAKYPQLVCCGKEGEYYKCNEALDYIKD